MKKVIFTLFMLAGGGVILSTLMSSGGSTGGQVTYEQAPPIPEKIFLQKLSSATSSGATMIMRIQYVADSLLPDELDIFENSIHTKTLKDDGVFPDIVAGDFIYATYLVQSITGFLGIVSTLESQLATNGGVYKFIGHDGEFINKGRISKFDSAAFNRNIEVEFPVELLNVTTCESTILKQNSLFITDLAVVEDPSRTFQFAHTQINDKLDALDDVPVAAVGNPDGAWTFGVMMKNMANQSFTGIPPLEFIREWLKTYTVDQSIGTFAAGGNANNAIAYNNALKREQVFKHLIAPWILKAWTVGSPPTLMQIEGGFEQYWDQLDETSMLRNAPFKLMAIVNRIDVRGNPAYNPGITNAGETRFIFTLINPETGEPPVHDNLFFPPSGTPTGVIDWVGMNVILEYGNPFSTNCDLQAFAQQWYNLSLETLGSSDYNDLLEAITNQVTDANAGGTKNENKSALNQLRTNEKIFDRVDDNAGEDWEETDWQFRQFELNSTGYLTPAVLTNTPVDEDDATHDLAGSNYHTYNHAKNINLFEATAPGYNLLDVNSDFLLNWIYGPYGTSINRHRVKIGMHNLPEEYLAGVARMYREMTHYFDFLWDWAPVNVYNEDSYIESSNNPNLLAKTIRHQISINTCQGCHSGENKTNFTHVYPRGFGEEANYWDPTPSVVNINLYSGIPPFPMVTNSIDDRFEVGGPTLPTLLANSGTTYQTYGGASHEKNLDFAEKTTNTVNQVVSPFLTGRKYSNKVTGSWEDDELNNSNSGVEYVPGAVNFLADNQLTG
ncbi:MAG: hypothetical protein IT222_04835, partial [Crocinitomix sp.]|nr:hypothetical protein [Crocinitomix sp.]